MRTVADVVTGNNGEYSFEAQAGKYCVYLKQDWRDEYCVGDISVYYDSKPGTLNDFLTALDEGDLKPDVVARFEEMVAQAKQYAEEAGQYAQQTAQDAETAIKARDEAEIFAAEAKQSAEATSEAVTDLMDEMKTKAPLDSPALTGTPTTPTPSLDATGREIANAEFVRALIAATPSGSYSTDSVIPLVINRTQLQSAHRPHKPLVINRAQLQSGYQIRACEPLIIRRTQLQSAHQPYEPLVINRAQLQSGHQIRAYGPLVVNRMGLSFAFITPLQRTLTL
ncbi:hypothetical protein DF41_25055 [Raoultella planticola]|nr:hypothetical protein DF41_25055 [Raoultella planticola]